MTKVSVAFIDLMGFSAAISEGLEVGARMLSDYNLSLEGALSDAKVKYRNRQVRQFAEWHGVSSFQHVMSLSDSVFIVSDDPSLFVLQLSEFLRSIFGLRSSTFARAGTHRNPSTVTVRTFSINKPMGQSEEETWFPALFQGGVAYEELGVLPSVWRVKKKRHKSFNLVGKAVVGAVKMEKQVEASRTAGPKVFCTSDFAKIVMSSTGPHADRARYYIGEYFDGSSDRDIEEIYWPMSYFDDDDPMRGISSGLPEPLAVALKFWAAHAENNDSVSRHYWGFARLLVQSARRIYQRKADDQISSIIERIAGDVNIDAVLIKSLFS